MRNDSIIRINQTLHGYFNGHSLLASSYQLHPIDERKMLILSDMSGASMTRGFETYLTGYRLAKESMYVLAKTWYAPEMERPGCVWTHSLLINSKDLGSIANPQRLLSYFERPQDQRWKDNYSKPITFEREFSNTDISDSNIVPKSDMAVVVSLLYENPSKQIFIPAETSSLYETLVLKIWEFQGAKTRQRFMFCTGAISDRSSSDMLFDLQIVPQRNISKIEKENKDQLIIQLDKIRYNDFPDWVENLVWKDMLNRSSSKLKTLLNKWDSDIQDGRTAYIKLLKIYFFYDQLANHFSDFNGIIDLIADEFPNSKDAIALKASFLNLGPKDNNWNEWDDERFLLCLFSTRNFKPFDALRVTLKEKATELLEQRSLQSLENLFSMILAMDINPLGEAFVEGIAEKIDASKLDAIAQASESLLRIIIYYNPFLGTNHLVWDASEEVQLSRLDLIASSPKITALITKDLIWCFLNANKYMLSYAVFDRFGALAVTATLDWIDNKILGEEVEISESWRNQLALRPQTVMDWLISLERTSKPNIRTLAWISQLLDPRSSVVRKYGVQVWLKNTQIKNSRLSEKEATEYSTFLLTLALDSHQLAAGELIAETFLTVYNAAKENKLSYDAWHRLSEKLPETPWYQSWDKCEQLRRGLVRKYSIHEIKTRDFIRATNQADVFEQIIQYAIDHKPIRHIIKSEIVYGQTESKLLSETQQEILRKYY
jgi:hypothetical protein